MTYSATFQGVTRRLTRWVKTENGGHSESDGFETSSVKVEIDVAAIAARLGRMAMANKSGCSKYLGGDVIVTVLTRVRT